MCVEIVDGGESGGEEWAEERIGEMGVGAFGHNDFNCSIGYGSGIVEKTDWGGIGLMSAAKTSRQIWGFPLRPCVFKPLLVNTISSS